MLRVTVLGAVSCFVFVLASVSEAQIGGGQITGSVTDSREAPVPGATVTATLKTRSAGRTVASSSSGVYTVPGLSPGDYRIDVELAGFRMIRRQGVRVETGETVRLDFVLEVGTLTDAVTVVADASTLRATGSLGQVISEDTIEGLPLNGRSFITLASLVPGVAVLPASPLPRINGGRPRTN